MATRLIHRLSPARLSPARLSPARLSPARLLLVAAAALVTTLGLTLPAHAEALVDASDSPQIQAGQTVDGSAYLAGQNVSVAGTVQGDLYCAANTVTITGTVLGDVLCAANNITLSGTVDGDVRLGSNTITLGGTVGGSGTLAANTVTTTDGSTVGSDLTVGGNVVDLAGDVGRDVRLGAATATVAGSVGRDVDAEVEKLSVTEGAQVTGHLHYTSNEDAAIAPGTVLGDVQRTTPPPTERYTGPTFGTWAAIALFWIAGFVVLSVLVALVLPRYVRTTAARDWRSLGMALLIGFLTFLAAGPAAILLLLTGVGAFASLLLWWALGVAMIIGSVLIAYTIGRAVLSHREGNVVGTTALGAVMLAVVGAVPVVGWLVVFLAACAGLGMIVLGLRSQYGPQDRRPVAGPYPASPSGPYGPHPGPGGPPAYRPGPGQPGPMQSGPMQSGPMQTGPVPGGATYAAGPAGAGPGRPGPAHEPAPAPEHAERRDDVRPVAGQESATSEAGPHHPAPEPGHGPRDDAPRDQEPRPTDDTGEGTARRE